MPAAAQEVGYFDENGNWIPGATRPDTHEEGGITVPNSPYDPFGTHDEGGSTVPNLYPAYTPQVPAPQPGLPPSAGPAYETRSGSGAFGTTLGDVQPSKGPTTEVRSGPGSFGGSGSTPPATSSAGSLLSGPGAYEQWIKEHQGQFENPTAVEDLYGTGAGKLGASRTSGLTDLGPTASGQLYDSGAGNLGAGRSAGLSSLGPGAVSDVYGRMGNAFDEKGALEDFYGKYGGDPMQKGYTETLYEGGIDKLNPFYDYAEKRAIDAAQRSSAGRGGFNSGLAAQQESDITGNLRGQQAKDMEQLAQAADSQKLARYGLGEKFAGDAGSAYTNRIKDVFGLAGAKDSSDLAIAGENRSRAGLADQEERARTEDKFKFAGQKDSADLATAGENRTRATSADEEERQRLAETFGIAGLNDAAKTNRLSQAGGYAKDLQATGQNRIAGALDATSGLDDKEASLVKSIYGDFSSVDKVDETWLQAEAEKYGISLEEMRDIAGAAGKGIDALVSLIGGKK